MSCERHRNRTLRLTQSAIAALLILYGCSEQAPAYPQRQRPGLLAEDLVAGQELFHDKCASCHGKPSEGRSDRSAFFSPPAPDFIDIHYQEIDPAYLYWRIDVGKAVEPYLSRGSVMPAWGVHFSEKQIWQIVAYLQSRAQ